MRTASRLNRLLPISYWLRDYSAATLTRDLLGAAIVSFLFIPQSLAYALQAGLPASAGLYASIVPLFGYALFGTSRYIAIGPFAITSLMTASILSRYAAHGSAEYMALALVLALISGMILTAMGMLRLGFLANFLSYPVSSGYVTASAILIAASQLKLILGVASPGSTLPEIVPGLLRQAAGFNPYSILLGSASLLALVLMRIRLGPLLRRLGVPENAASLISRTGPLITSALAGAAVYGWQLEGRGVKVVGHLDGGIPPLTMPPLDTSAWLSLAFPALLLSIVGFVSSVSTAQAFAAKDREVVNANSELIGLGAGNVLAAFCGGFPVTAGFSRTVVNHGAGVRTPLSSIFTGLGIALVTGIFAPLLYYLPLPALAATIIVAVMSLADLKILSQTWAYSRSDFFGAAVTIAATLLWGVEIGILCGVLLSVALFLYRTSRPHMAVVGLVPNTEHFRNVLRHDVMTSPHILSVRVDESLYFANARYLEERLTELVIDQPQAKHLVLICSAVNDIDASALESLESLNERLKDMEVTFHLSEVKGPVMDRLRRSDFLGQLTGRVFLSQFHAVADLDPALLKRAWSNRQKQEERQEA